MDTADKRMAVMNLPKHIKKSHQLVFSRQDLTPREADVFALMIAHMKPEDWDQEDNYYRFTASQLSVWFNVETKHIGTIFDPVAKRLLKKSIGVKTLDEDGNVRSFRYRSLFTDIEYKDGVLNMEPNKRLKKEYIEYNQGFALINTRNYLGLKTEYSKRLYEILSRFKTGNIKVPYYKIDELKGLFGLLDESGKLKTNKKSLDDTSTFIRRVIRTAINEISTNSETNKEIVFKDNECGTTGYRVIKKNRKIIAIEFIYEWVKRKEIVVEPLLDFKQAMIIIKDLEIRRLQKKEKLSNQELMTLSNAYLALGQQDEANEIKATIDNSENADMKDITNFLEKIKKMKELNKE